MNYRHGFHAGNPADCVKHALLVWLLAAMQRKPGPVLVLDTHAGSGRTDLSGAEAARTGEWRSGIARLWPDPPEPLRDYVRRALPNGPPAVPAAQAAATEAAAAATQAGAAASAAATAATPPASPDPGDVAPEPGCGPTHPYLGSPALAGSLLRPQDRLVCCELHPQEHAALRRLFAGNRQVAVHRRDGHDALRAFLPPPERRALVLIDPPFEQPDEFARLAASLAAAQARFPPAVLAAWYPVKHRAPVRAFHAAIRGSGLRDVVAAELWLREPTDPARLNGSGLLLVRPPWQFEAAAAERLDALLSRLGTGEAGQGVAVTRLADE